MERTPQEIDCTLQPRVQIVEQNTFEKVYVVLKLAIRRRNACNLPKTSSDFRVSN